MDDKPINISNNTQDSSAQVKKPDDAQKNSLKTGGATNIIRVPKQQAVVSPIKQRIVSDSKAPKTLKELKKQKEREEKQRQKEEKDRQKEEKQKLEQKEKQVKQTAVLKDKVVKETKTKEQKKKEKQEAKQKRKEEKEKARVKDFNLDNLTALENIVLRRIEEKEEKKRRRIIILLIIFLVIMITVGSCTAIEIIDEHKPEPIAVDISVEAGWLDRELIDPNNPDAGYVEIVLYPGDTVNVNFFVSNLQLTKNFPVFLRFRAYIIIDDLSEHHVFIPTFKDAEMWYSRSDNNTNGVQIDDWFYYGELLQIGYENRVQILQAIKLSENLGNEYQGKEYTLVSEVEVVEGDNQAIKDFESWWLAPEEWLELMGITIDD